MRKRFNIVFALLFLSLMLISCGDGGSGGGGGGGSGIQENDGDIINTDSIRMESTSAQDPSTVTACITNYGDNPANPGQNIIFLDIKFNFKPRDIDTRRLLGPLSIHVDTTGSATYGGRIQKWAKYNRYKVRAKINGQAISGEGLEGNITDRRFQPSTCPAASPRRNAIEASLDYHVPTNLQGQALHFQFFVVDQDGQEYPLTHEVTYSRTMIESSESCRTVMGDQSTVNTQKALHQTLDLSPLGPE